MTKSEYEQKYQQNIKYEGFGLETKTIMPCPGCAEPDFVEMPVLDPMVHLVRGQVCKHCGRAFKAFVKKKEFSTEMKIVQIGGPALPDYLAWMERYEE